MSTPAKMRPKKGAAKQKDRTSVQEKQDGSIMNTNDSSIVSKRSVSKLYFPSEPDFYEPFVQKYVRRNPLINRGYWLRMHAIEQVVKLFLEEDSEFIKVVVNLGCGYDPLPFQFWHRYASLSQNAIFVDVDYPQLIGRKRDRILTNDLLRDALLRTNMRSSQLPVYVRSERYIAVGCDLRDLPTLERLLRAELDVACSSILFVGEVSLTYMPVPDSDSLIRWASAFDHARFCLLEQYLPQGRNHPFAQTMLRHFDKLHTPIHAVKQYPSLSQQSSRFTSAGWLIKFARNLWDLWSDEAFTPSVVRRGLAAVEPFDEWEEFALFCGHYFLLVASNAEDEGPIGRTTAQSANTCTRGTDGIEAPSLILTYHEPEHPPLIPRRFAAAFSLDPGTVGFHGGQGLQSRLSSVDILEREGSGSDSKIQPCRSAPPQARICHTVTPLGGASALLVGGRSSPTNALADCWLVKHGAWQRVHDLSPGRFRHSSVRLVIRTDESAVEGVMVFGGKSGDDMVLDDWTLWTPDQGWITVPVDGPRPSARFGAAISAVGATQSWGLLVGGMAPSGTVLNEIWEWRMLAAPHLHLKFTDRTNEIRDTTGQSTYGRLGANLVLFENALLLIGGVSRDRILGLSEDFVLIFQGPGSTAIQVGNSALALPPSTWPLLVGTGAAAVSQDEVVIAGGGAVCFSMGSFWNKGYITITKEKTKLPPWTVSMSQLSEEGRAEGPISPAFEGRQASAKQRMPIRPKAAVVPRRQLLSPGEFTQILAASKPVIIEGQNVGPCCDLWTLDYLKGKIGADREVVIHECISDRMTFKDKNFQYVKKSFGEFIDGIATGSRTYLRALSSSQPNKLPTDLEKDFPAIAEDFRLPDVFEVIKANQHSSPLRISGPVSLWLHYDVLANVLCQIRGSKTLYLYPPSDVQHLAYPPGGSSSNIDVLNAQEPMLRNTHPHVALLKPGDILFIPPMWSHAAVPEEGLSVAVNVFFKNLENGYASGRDVYGNRDLAAYENGRRDIEKISKAFRNIPGDIAKFYLDRLVAELREKANAFGKVG